MRSLLPGISTVALLLSVGAGTLTWAADENVTAVDGASASAAAPLVDFNREVRPILSNSCFQCHGPDEGSRQIELRLDTKAGAFADLGGEAVIVPGDPEASELWQRVSSDDPDVRMPPTDSNQEALTPAQIDTLRRWIEQGADWQEHWAFVAPVRPPLPDVGDSSWPHNEIDRFTLAAMRAHKFEPSEEASPETLLRRLTLDLTGLPPTIEELDEFLSDQSPDRYERAVDRLLRSPRYGEQMTRDWLDVARYGDTHGLHLDNERSIWMYRNWLIDAFNANRPFDQMTIEQVAGDLLPDATTWQRVATGFNRCNVSTNEGGAIEEEVHVRNTVDRVTTFSTVYLGLTMGCCVCHDHKFDPITQREFYGLTAFFNSLEAQAMDGNSLLHPPFIEVPSDEQRSQREELQQAIAGVNAEIQSALAALDYTDPAGDADPESLPAEDYVWIDDDVPSGALLQHDGPEWEWVAEGVHSGTRATRRTVDALGQHFFTGATPPLILGKGDKLFAHVWLDEQNPPQAIMLQFNDGSWEHRAYWGTAQIPFGDHNTPGKRRMGTLPEIRRMGAAGSANRQSGPRPGGDRAWVGLHTIRWHRDVGHGWSGHADSAGRAVVPVAAPVGVGRRRWGQEPSRSRAGGAQGEACRPKRRTADRRENLLPGEHLSGHPGSTAAIDAKANGPGNVADEAEQRHSQDDGRGRNGRTPTGALPQPGRV